MPHGQSMGLQTGLCAAAQPDFGAWELEEGLAPLEGFEILGHGSWCSARFGSLVWCSQAQAGEPGLRGG